MGQSLTTIDFDNLMIPIPRMNANEKRATTYWWVLTQLSGYTLYKLFLYIYESFPDSENGTKTILSFTSGRGLNIGVFDYFERSNLEINPQNKFFDISFIRSIFQNVFKILNQNDQNINAIAREISSFNSERNKLCHNRIQSLTPNEFTDKIRRLRTKLTHIFDLTTRINPSKANDILQLKNEVFKEMEATERKSETGNFSILDWFFGIEQQQT